MQRENGQFTYFASDIAYHLNKFERGFDQVINIWGADHHGYIPRVKGALQALELDAEKLQIALVQFAVLYLNLSLYVNYAKRLVKTPRDFFM